MKAVDDQVPTADAQWTTDAGRAWASDCGLFAGGIHGTGRRMSALRMRGGAVWRQVFGIPIASMPATPTGLTAWLARDWPASV